MSNKYEEFSICIIGAGFSGICAAAQLKRQLGFTNFKIIDKNEDFGGVWWKNRYPGCASDVISHLYSLSFETNPEWSKGFAPQPEILAYLKKIAEKYTLYENALFSYTIETVQWVEELSKWRITVLNKNAGERMVMEFNVVINGQGRFTSPKIPDQFLPFRNPIVHSALWNSNISLEGKRVGIVGLGSTGAQIIPSIAPLVDKLYLYIRRPPYIVPASQYQYPPIVRWLFRNIPGLQLLHRWYLYVKHETFCSVFSFGSKVNAAAKGFCKLFIKKEIKDEKLQEKLTPTYEFGCKRIIPSSDLYPALNRSNVEVIGEPITLVDGNSITTGDNDRRREVDVLILATGFDVQDTYSTFKLIGREGIDVYNEWSLRRPSAYLGVVTSSAPNHFFLLGPNSSSGYTSILFPLECQVNWTIQVVKEMLRRNYLLVKVLASVEEEYMKDLHERMKGKIYVVPSCGDCDSWFRNSKGDVVEFYPRRTFNYWRKTFWLNSADVEFQ